MSDRQLRFWPHQMIRTDAGPHGPAHILAALLRCRYNCDITILQRNFRPIFPVGSLTGAPRKPALFSVAEQQSQHERDSNTETQNRRYQADGAPEPGHALLSARHRMGAERLNLALSKVGNPPIYNNATFPWTGSIETSGSSSTACSRAKRNCPPSTNWRAT